MQQPARLQKTALRITRLIGSPQSVVIHTILFIVCFALALWGLVAFDEMLLLLTTIVSLEAIYLSLFIQMTVNYTTEAIEAVGEDIEDIQEDVGEIQKDVDELQEDVEEISEEDADEEHREDAQQSTLEKIQGDLRKLMEDIEQLNKK